MENFVQIKVASKQLIPEEITNILGISCDKSWLIGDKRGKSIIVEKSNGWILKSDLNLSDELENHVDNVLGKIIEAKEKLKSISDKVTVELKCAIYSDSIPALYFDNECIQRVSEIGASLDIDLYHLDD